MKRLLPTPEGLAQAAEFIRRGEVVAYPTETVYGLGVNPFEQDALARLFQLKGRPAGKPVLLIVAEVEQLLGVVHRISPDARACMAAFWPGPLSLLFPAAPTVPASLTGDSNRVCVRQPGLEAARALCRLAGAPITSTSANRAGEPPATSPDMLDVPGVAAVLDGGVIEERPPSTVFDPEARRILRAGAVPWSALEAALGR